MSKTQNLYSFKYSKNSDFKTFGVTGAYGGVTVNGHLNVNFYTDIADLPRESKHEIINDRIVISPTTDNDNKGNSSIREVLCGINLDIKTAKTIIEWMRSHIEEFEKAQQPVSKEIENQN